MEANFFTTTRPHLLIALFFFSCIGYACNKS